MEHLEAIDVVVGRGLELEKSVKGGSMFARFVFHKATTLECPARMTNIQHLQTKMEQTTARLRKTFHYPTENDSEDSLPEALDEEGTAHSYSLPPPVSLSAQVSLGNSHTT